LGDDRDRVFLAPSGELFARCGAKGVPRSEQHRAALILEVPCELADRSRLARAVDSCEHDDARFLAGQIERPLERREQLDENGPQRRFQLRRGPALARALA